MFKTIRESFDKKEGRALRMISLLKKKYPQARCSLIFENPLQLLVATRLSAQCTDERVNLVTPALFKKNKSAKDFAKASQSELEKMIRSTGFFRGKAKSIRMAAETFVEKFGGEGPG